MSTTPKNGVGDEILVDPGTDEQDRAKHPAEKDLKLDDQKAAVHGDAEVDDPPVRTHLPDVPVIQRLGTGAGQHVPGPGATAPDEFDEQGRPKGNPSTAYGDPDPDAQEASTAAREADPTDDYERPKGSKK